MSEHQDEPVTITDKRRIDPETGDLREDITVVEGDGQISPESSTTEESAAVQDKIAELTSDLQRAHADFENFRRRTERDRAQVIEFAKASVVGELLVILDDLERASQHGHLENSPLKPIVEKLESTLKNLGLEKFGEAGEGFDPALHEAVQQEGEGLNPIIDTVYRSGYKFKDKLLRTAMVVVGDGSAETPAES